MYYLCYQLKQKNVLFRQLCESTVPFVSTVGDLPIAQVEPIPLSVQVDIPAYGNMNMALPVTYILHNRYGQVI